MNAQQLWNKFENKSNYTKFSAAYFLSQCNNINGIYLTYKLFKEEYNYNYEKSPLDFLHLQFTISIPPNSTIEELLNMYIYKDYIPMLEKKSKIYWREKVIELTKTDPGPI